MITIELTAGEMAIAKQVAQMRRETNQKAGTHDARRDKKQPAIKLDLLGAISEIAWAKAWNRYPDLTINPRSGGADATTMDGKKVDIKATDRPNGRLLATTGKKAKDADFYVLAIVRHNIVTFVGWVKSEELLNESTITDLGCGPTHALDQQDLRPFSQYPALAG